LLRLSTGEAEAQPDGKEQGKEEGEEAVTTTTASQAVDSTATHATAMVNLNVLIVEGTDIWLAYVTAIATHLEAVTDTAPQTLKTTGHLQPVQGHVETLEISQRNDDHTETAMSNLRLRECLKQPLLHRHATTTPFSYPVRLKTQM
jgi:hypothetical protein